MLPRITRMKVWTCTVQYWTRIILDEANKLTRKYEHESLDAFILYLK